MFFDLSRFKNVISVLVVCFIFLVASNNAVFAAAIGERIVEPESGWTRYDDRDINLVYTGVWTRESYQSSYNGTLSYIFDKEQTCTFKFQGTKLRIISNTNKTGTKSANINIDGVDYNYSNYSSGVQIPDNTQLLLFEKTDLPLGNHIVIISTPENEFGVSLDAIDIDENGTLLDPNTSMEPTVSVDSSEGKIDINHEIEVDINLNNVNQIYAEDIYLNYDPTYFEFVSATTSNTLKIYNTSEKELGNLRYIVASQGKENGISGTKSILKLKFRAIKAGESKIDVIKCKVSDLSKEFDIVNDNCLDKTFIIEGMKDINRTDEFTLIDLALSGYYFGMSSSDTDTTKYDVDLVGNGVIDDTDLKEVVSQIILNINYSFNE